MCNDFKQGPLLVWTAAAGRIGYGIPARAEGVECFVNMLYLGDISLKSLHMRGPVPSLSTPKTRAKTNVADARPRSSETILPE